MLIRTGVAVVVVRDGKLLLGERRGAHGAGTWSMPGGKPDAGETLLACALRELAEETGLRAATARWVDSTLDLFDEVTDGQRLCYRTHYLLAERVEGEPEVVEPAKCGGWGWFSWDEPPQPLFLPLRNLRRKGVDPTRL